MKAIRGPPTSPASVDPANAVTFVLKSNGVEVQRRGQKPIAMLPNAWKSLSFDGSLAYGILVDLQGSETIQIDGAAVVGLGQVMQRNPQLRFKAITPAGIDAFGQTFRTYACLGTTHIIL